MNFHPVVSAIAASNLSGKEHLALTLTANGVDIAAAGDLVIGTLQRGAAQGLAVAVHLSFANGLHYAQIGDGTAIAVGDLLQQAAGGKLVKKTTGQAVAVAWESLLGSNTDAQIRVLYLRPTDAAATQSVVAAGVRTWAGGAATTDSVSVPGLLAGDVVTATLVARAGSETLVLTTADAVADTLTFLLSANGTNGTTKIAYQVSRGV